MLQSKHAKRSPIKEKNFRITKIGLVRGEFRKNLHMKSLSKKKLSDLIVGAQILVVSSVFRERETRKSL